MIVKKSQCNFFYKVGAYKFINHLLDTHEPSLLFSMSISFLTEN